MRIYVVGALYCLLASSTASGQVAAGRIDSVFVRTRNIVTLRTTGPVVNLPKGAKLLALDFDGHVWTVRYGNQVGTLWNIDVMATPEDQRRVQEHTEQLAQEKARAKQAQRDSAELARAMHAAEFDGWRAAIIKDRRWVASREANVRSGPSRESDVVASLHQDALVTWQNHRAIGVVSLTPGRSPTEIQGNMTRRRAIGSTSSTGGFMRHCSVRKILSTVNTRALCDRKRMSSMRVDVTL